MTQKVKQFLEKVSATQNCPSALEHMSREDIVKLAGEMGINLSDSDFSASEGCDELSDSELSAVGAAISAAAWCRAAASPVGAIPACKSACARSRVQVSLKTAANAVLVRLPAARRQVTQTLSLGWQSAE